MLILNVEHHDRNCFYDSLDHLLYLKMNVWQKPLNKWICKFMGKHSDIKWMQKTGQEYSDLLVPVKIILPYNHGIADGCFLTKIRICWRGMVISGNSKQTAEDCLFYKISFCKRVVISNDKEMYKQENC